MQSTHVHSGILFSVCLNLKHINLYYAPVVFMFLLSGYCIPYSPGSGRQLRLANFVPLALAVIAVFAISLGPFIMVRRTCLYLLCFASCRTDEPDPRALVAPLPLPARPYSRLLGAERLGALQRRGSASRER